MEGTFFLTLDVTFASQVFKAIKNGALVAYSHDLASSLRQLTTINNIDIKNSLQIVEGNPTTSRIMFSLVVSPADEGYRNIFKLMSVGSDIKNQLPAVGLVQQANQITIYAFQEEQVIRVK